VTPQTLAAREAFEQNRAIFLAPGIAPPAGTYRYALLGPMLEVRNAPQTQQLLPPLNISITQPLTLSSYSITTALEPTSPRGPPLIVEANVITPTRTARVWLDWRADGAVPNFSARLRLYDPEARVVAQIDEPPVRGLYPPSQWTQGEYVRDIHNFLVPGGTPPGKYKLTLTAFEKEVELGTLSVERITTLGRDQVFVAHPLDVGLDERMAIVGYGGFEGVRRAGEAITFNVLWSVHENVGRDVGIYVSLLDANGKKVLELQRAPIAYYAARDWQRGELLKAYYDVTVPTDTRGELSLMLGMSAQDLKLIGKIQVTP
jgi:hypothetical protein